jgi:hypothetical protein
MFLVLCHDYDEAARWVSGELRAAGLGPLELVTDRELERAPVWNHRLGAEGIGLTIELDDGRVLRHDQVRGVLNRLIAAPGALIGLADPADRDYAAAEMAAFYMSWLAGLANVINRSTPQGICGSWRHSSEWAVLAARAGLAVPPYRQTDSDPERKGYGGLAPPEAAIAKIIVLRGELYGAVVPDGVGAACRRLAQGSLTELLGIDLFEDEGGTLTFAHATPWPDLRPGGVSFVDALCQALSRAGAA